MSVTPQAIEAGRCELCGARFDGSARDRFAHFRTEHPAYARGLVLRLVAPIAFVALVLVLGAVKAPAWAYLVALGASFGLLFFGKVRSRVERSRAGARSTIGFKRLVREGGLGILVMIPIVIVLIVLISR